MPKRIRWCRLLRSPQPAVLSIDDPNDIRHVLVENNVNYKNWVDRYVVAAVLIQLIGYAALSALVPHSDFAAVVEPLQRVPAILLVPVALVAVPAVILAVILGALLAVLGLQPTTVLVFISIYFVSVVGRWTHRRVTYSASTTNT